MDSPEPAPPPPRRGLPMYAKVVIACGLGVLVGMALGIDGAAAESLPGWGRGLLRFVIGTLAMLPKIILKAITAVGAPLIFLAIITAITTNDVSGRQGLKMMGWYGLNTAVAICIGLALSLAVKPGEGAVVDLGSLVSSGKPRLAQVLVPIQSSSELPAKLGIADLVMDLVPRSLGDAFARNHIAQLAFIGLAVAVALAGMRKREKAEGGPAAHLIGVVSTLFEMAIRILGWIVALVPLAVFGVVAVAVGYTGFALFKALGALIATVLVGLGLQFGWYLTLMAVRGKCSPLRFLKALPDVLGVAFSSSSSAATLPRTLDALQQKLGVSRASSQLAACVGTNFNNDGTALYQAAVALFFAQASGLDLTVGQSIALALATVIAAFGAGGIPSGSFVTLPLLFGLAGIPVAGLPVLLTVDWFLDRVRTAVNVSGDMSVAVLIDPKDAGASPPPRG